MKVAGVVMDGVKMDGAVVIDHTGTVAPMALIMMAVFSNIFTYGTILVSLTYYKVVSHLYLPPTTNDSLLTTHDSRLTTHDSRLTTHYSLLTTHDSLLIQSPPDPHGVVELSNSELDP